MPGFSITLLLLPTDHTPAAPPASLILSLLDDKSNAPGWRWSSGVAPQLLPTQAPVAEGRTTHTAGLTRLRSSDPTSFLTSIERACKALITAEPEITRMDTIAGDGDCGLTLKVPNRISGTRYNMIEPISGHTGRR